MHEDKIKLINIKEFREKGYLQELNRLFLHPIGLAMAIGINEHGEEFFNGIWDYRKDAEGIYYDLKNSNEERISKFLKNEKFIKLEIEKRRSKRIDLLGDNIEPIN